MKKKIINLVVWILKFVGGSILMILLYGISQQAVMPMEEGSYLIDNLWVRTAVVLAVCFALLSIYRFFVRFALKENARDISRKKFFPHLPAGLAIGYLYFLAVVGVMVICGCYEVASVQFPSTGLYSMLLLYLVVAVGEEVLCRGIMFRMLDERWGFHVALVISALIFGFMHYGNPNSTLWSCTAIAIESGLMFGVAYKLSGSLWVPIGIHWAWNFTQGNILGFSVSGTAEGPSVITPLIQGPELLTGGSFGAEASIIATLLGTLITIWLYYKYYKIKHDNEKVL